MARPISKAYLGSVAYELKLGSLHKPLAKIAAGENLPLTDLIRRECALFLCRRGLVVDNRFLEPPPLRSRLKAATSRRRR